MRNLLFTSILCISVAGCASLGSVPSLGPEPTPVEADVPSPFSDNWSASTAQGVATTDWVSSFSDVTLNAMVDEALSSNTSILAAEAGYRAALARLDVAKADRYPTLDASFNASKSRSLQSNTSQDALLLGFVPDITTYGFGVNSSWEVDIWGRVRNQVQSANYSAAAQQADYAGVRLAIAGQVAQTWFNLIEARLLTEVSERDVATQERALRLTNRRFEGGVTGSSDVRLARSAVASAQAQLAARRRVESATTRALEVLLRRYPSESMTAADDLPQLPRLQDIATPSNVLTRRPDILVAESQMRAAGVDVDIARKNLLPRLTLSGGLNANEPRLQDLLDIESFVARIAAGVAQPIFQGGRLRANVEQREALLWQALENYARIVLNAYLEVEDALDAETRLAEQETALRVSLDEAFQAERRLEIRYSEGLATILQLLDAQSRRISAESQLISARKERLANRVRLHVALGGGLETQNTLQANLLD